ncbi:histidine phosphatase family protein, partial [bacterium]|nr:histidine phosphatase family protein [bacterium]
DLVRVVEQLPDDAATVFLVGHNPGISGLAAYFAGEDVGNLPTCSVCAIDFQINSWQDVFQGLGTCQFWDYPKKQ